MGCACYVQVLLWDITDYQDRLQVGKGVETNIVGGPASNLVSVSLYSGCWYVDVVTWAATRCDHKELGARASMTHLCCDKFCGLKKL